MVAQALVAAADAIRHSAATLIRRAMISRDTQRSVVNFSQPFPEALDSIHAYFTGDRDAEGSTGRDNYGLVDIPLRASPHFCDCCGAGAH